MTDVKTVADLDAGATEALRNTLVALADSKRVMGIRYSDWLLGAPSLETSASSMSVIRSEWPSGPTRSRYERVFAFPRGPYRHLESPRAGRRDYCTCDRAG